MKMKQLQAIIFAFLMVTLLTINHVNARLPPPEARRPSTSGSSSSSELSSSSSSSSPSNPTKPDSSATNPAESAVPAGSDSESNSDHDEFEDALQQSLRAFEFLRRRLDSLPNTFPTSWNPRVLYPPSFGMMSGSDEDSAEDPLRMFSPVFRPIFHRDPHFSFFPRMPELPLNRPSIQGFDPIAKGYTKINDTRFVVHGREYCQSTYEKVEDKGFGVFTSRIITAQPCEQATKDDREGSVTDLPAAEDNSKKQDDRRVARPEVEREDQPSETPAAAGSSNREPNEIKPEVTKNQEPTTTAQPTTDSDVKPKEKSVENEISDKPAESTGPEPTITVNDGK